MQAVAAGKLLFGEKSLKTVGSDLSGLVALIFI